ncbi:hypothetical protein LCGC14_0145510 [marine sediment metagenome]|uniref:Uncharacterized protein n=1 Tax=marine sediment metagenome TaxID=412755 RepID=A0A0F9XH98_9ZZZZ
MGYTKTWCDCGSVMILESIDDGVEEYKCSDEECTETKKIGFPIDKEEQPHGR